MDLLSILKSNGTGLLEGLCRPHNRNNHDESSFITLKTNDKLKVDFSLGVEYLGVYEIKVESAEDDGTKLDCIITETENDGMGFVALRIYIKDMGDFGRFEAHDCR